MSDQPNYIDKYRALPMGKRVQLFVALRDKIGAMRKAQGEELKKFTSLLESMENEILVTLNANQTDGMKTPAGTAYKIVQTSVTVPDQAVFRDYVIETQKWDLTDWRASKGAVTAFVDDTGQAPPGVNVTKIQTVGVRRASATDK